MLFWIGLELDYARMAGRAAELVAAETDRLRALREEGVLMRAWQRVNGRGRLMLWNVRDAGDADQRIESLPTFHYAMRLEAEALNPHRIFRQFAEPRRASGRARASLYLVRLLMDRSRIGPERPAALLEEAEKNARRHVDAGQTVGIWRLPHGSGAILVLECRNNEELHHELSTLPLKGYFSEVSATPIVPDPAFPDLAGWNQEAP